MSLLSTIDPRKHFPLFFIRHNRFEPFPPTPVKCEAHAGHKWGLSVEHASGGGGLANLARGGQRIFVCLYVGLFVNLQLIGLTIPRISF